MYKTELLHEWIPVDELVDKYTDSPRFIEYCKACPSYGAQWGCPPLPFEPSEYMHKYKNAYVLGLKIYFGNDCIREADTKEKIQEESKKASMYGVDRLYSITEGLREKYKDSAMLVYGKCPLCKECVRKKGKACLHPEEMNYSLSGFGIDTQKLMKDVLKIDLLWPQETLPKYLTMVFVFMTNADDIKID